MTLPAVNLPPGARQPSLFRSRNFRVYWTGGFASNIGSWLQNVTGSVYIMEATHSTFLVGLLNVATFVPLFLFSIAGGMISDRFDRRAVIIVTHTISGAVAAAVALLAAFNRLSAPLLLGAAFLLGSSYAISKPAFTAILPSFVARSELARATAINTLQFNMGMLGGSALSAAILAIASPTWAFAVNAISFLAPIVAMLMLRVDRQERTSSIRGSGREGLRFVLRSPAILTILAAVALANASLECLRTLAPSLLDTTMRLDAESAGLLVMACSAGGTAGIFGFTFLTGRFSDRHLLIVAFVMQAAGLAGLAESSNIFMGIAFSVPIGLAFALNIPILSASLQLLSPDLLRGRVMSFFSISMFGLRPLFSLLSGGLAVFLSPPLVLLVFVLFPLLALPMLGANSRAVATTRTGDTSG
ncbi:MAG: transporter [Sphaerisporangium sp.]|nr:transporter [Sphaerisporangium sp.]